MSFDSIRQNILDLFESGQQVRWVHEGTPPARTVKEKYENTLKGHRKQALRSLP